MRTHIKRAKNRAWLWAVCAVLCLAAAVAAQDAKPSAAVAVRWNDILEQAPAWYESAEAARIADNVLLYQRDTGGWHKNIDMAAVLNERQTEEIAREKPKTDATIDNGATFTQLIFLGKVYTAAKHERHREAFVKGLDYLLKAQYDNGGWPQFYPLQKNYSRHITFNDGAMIGVMKLLRDIAAKKSDYAFVDEGRRAGAEKAVEKGVEAILKTQVVVRGKRTVWGAQHDEVTFAPAPARKFEPVALASAESVGIVRFLLGIKNPDARIIEAVEAAVAWFEKSKLEGIRWVVKRDAAKPGVISREVVRDANAGPLWARFYEIETTRPVFAGREGVVKYDVAEIEAERRNGYAWYVETPAKLLNQEYPAWRKKLADAKTGQNRLR